ncbi:sugar phosphate isomerase/epimerase family protein [Vallicoccus soli]|uniref:Sugar phosphate isomerase/epimerase n=1 Tax=Vallicoccus soli TaxID=2339232 RepID=A0A3A3Z1W8_9ACTN|nr:sugar phosphate isomerase/epimerase [Vallicoccus soli]RJK98269.1 sugar phosphate isomerase/epimerase [Vallicoccus soli]
MCNGPAQHPARPEEVAALASRRGFLKAAAGTAALAGAGGALAAPARAADDHGDHGDQRIPVRRISIQLYTVRDILSQDVDLTLSTLRDIGYRNVETAGAPAGLTVQEFREALDDHGLRATSAHIGIPQPFDAAAWRQSLRDARTLGATYVNHPYFGTDEDGPIRDAARYEALARDLDRAGRIARNHRIQFGYHNHHNEFLRMDDGSGRTGMDILLEETDPALVHFQLDLYWVWRGAHDPVDVIRAHPGRFRQFHVKDMGLDALFEDPGQGLIDFPRIFRQARRGGTVEFIVERDDAGTDPREPEDALETAEVGFDFLRGVRY